MKNQVGHAALRNKLQYAVFSIAASHFYLNTHTDDALAIIRLNEWNKYSWNREIW